jgi:N-acetylglucosaminyl-diphospho-decaprenol L-rhamnosyltransferase
VTRSIDVSICILTRNQPELLQMCVASCVAEASRNALDAELIIIDNASTDGAPQRVAGVSPNVRVIRSEENLGFAIANNKAIRASRGRAVLVLNDDAVLQEGSLVLMLRRLDSDPKIAAVGPKLLNPDGTLQRGFTNRRFPHLRGLLCGFLGLNPLFERHAFTRDLFTHSKDPNRSGETDHLAGACLLLRCKALDTVGLFHQGFYFFFEDTDLCYRLQEAGWKIFYLSEAPVTHYGSASFKRMLRFERDAIYFKSLLCFFKRHSNPLRYYLLKAGVTAVLLLEVPLALFLGFRAGGSGWAERRRAIQVSLQSLRSIVLGRY